MQPELFYEGYYEALRDDVAAIGGAKVCGVLFWPEKSIEGARTKLNDALNPERRERLTDEQERLIMRRAREVRGYSAGLCFLCDDLGFERTKALDVEDHKAKMQRELIRAVGDLRKITEALGVNHMLPDASMRVVR